MGTQSEIVVLLLTSIAGAAFGGVVVVKLGRLLDRARRRRRARHASHGEYRAERLLRARGFKIVDRQVNRPWALLINGRKRQFNLRADLIVKKRGRRYVAEVKTGSHVASIHHGPTRRQLLEYSHAFETDGVLLVEVDSAAVQEIWFPGAHTPRPAPARALVVMLLLSLAAAGVHQLLVT